MAWICNRRYLRAVRELYSCLTSPHPVVLASSRLNLSSYVHNHPVTSSYPASRVGDDETPHEDALQNITSSLFRDAEQEGAAEPFSHDFFGKRNTHLPPSPLIPIPIEKQYQDALRRLFRRNAEQKSIILTYEDMLAEILPSPETFNMLIGCATNKRDIGLAELFLAQSKSFGYPVTYSVYNSLLAAFGALGSKEGVLRTIEDMSRDGYKMSPVSYTALMRTCALRGEVGIILEAARKAEKEGVSIDDSTIAEIIPTVASNFPELNLPSLVKRYSKGEKFAYDLLVSALFYTDQKAAGRALLDEMRAKGLTPDDKTYGAIFRALARFNDLIELNKHYADAKLGRLAYSLALLQGSTPEGMERAKQVWADIMRARVRPAFAAVARLIWTALSHGHLTSVHSLWDDMVIMGYYPKISLCSMYLEKLEPELEKAGPAEAEWLKKRIEHVRTQQAKNEFLPSEAEKEYRRTYFHSLRRRRERSGSNS